MGISDTRSLTCRKNELTKGLLEVFMEPLAPDTVITISSSMSDRPGEVSTVTLTATIDLDRIDREKGRIY